MISYYIIFFRNLANLANLPENLRLLLLGPQKMWRKGGVARRVTVRHAFLAVALLILPGVPAEFTNKSTKNQQKLMNQMGSSCIIYIYIDIE